MHAKKHSKWWISAFVVLGALNLGLLAGGLRAETVQPKGTCTICVGNTTHHCCGYGCEWSWECNCDGPQDCP